MIATLSPQQVIDAVTLETGITLPIIQTNSRKAEHVLARMHLVLSLKLVFEGFTSLRAIGGIIGKRDHATILHGKNTALDTFEVNHEFRAAQMRIFKALDISFKWDNGSLVIWK